MIILLICYSLIRWSQFIDVNDFSPGGCGGGGVLGLGYPIIVYSVVNYRPHLSHFWASVIFAIPTLLLSIFFYELSHFLDWMENTYFSPTVQTFWFANRNYEELSYSQKSENVRPHSSKSIKNATLSQSIQSWKCDPIQRHIPIPISLLRGSTPTTRGFQGAKAGTVAGFSLSVCTILTCTHFATLFERVFNGS